MGRSCIFNAIRPGSSALNKYGWYAVFEATTKKWWWHSWDQSRQRIERILTDRQQNWQFQLPDSSAVTRGTSLTSLLPTLNSEVKGTMNIICCANYDVGVAIEQTGHNVRRQTVTRRQAVEIVEMIEQRLGGQPFNIQSIQTNEENLATVCFTAWSPSCDCCACRPFYKVRATTWKWSSSQPITAIANVFQKKNRRLISEFIW